MPSNQLPNLLPNPCRLGILGGGQLARMLSLAGAPLGLECHILSEHSHDPAAQVTSHWTQGTLTQIQTLRNFAEKVDLLTFESEFVDSKILTQALSGLKVRVFPSIKSLGLLQDRATQKQILVESKISTSPFLTVSKSSELEQACAQFHGAFVLKARKNGYDGNGTFYCRHKSDLPKLKAKLQTKFHDLAGKNPSGFIAEEFVPFKRECALMIFRSADGSFTHFPLVETLQKDSRCDWVLGPEQHPGLKKLIPKLKKMTEALDYVGALGVELFDTGKELMVNELAPRVHNSGHYSQNCLAKDQFALHLLSGLGQPLSPVKLLSPAFAMVNLIGSKHQMPALAMATSCRESNLHWYGKSENRPGRKMGHLNLCGPNKKSILKTLLLERKKFDL